MKPLVSLENWRKSRQIRGHAKGREEIAYSRSMLFARPTLLPAELQVQSLLLVDLPCRGPELTQRIVAPVACNISDLQE